MFFFFPLGGKKYRSLFPPSPPKKHFQKVSRFAGFAAAVGLVSVFCGAVNCPIASVFLSVELFGAEGMLYFALACGLSFVLSGYNGLYSSQRILYSKLKAQYIDVRTNAHHAGEVTEAERTHR